MKNMKKGSSEKADFELLDKLSSSTTQRISKCTNSDSTRQLGRSMMPVCRQFTTILTMDVTSKCTPTLSQVAMAERSFEICENIYKSSKNGKRKKRRGNERLMETIIKAMET
jgi:hypothetical protein